MNIVLSKTEDVVLNLCPSGIILSTFSLSVVLTLQLSYLQNGKSIFLLKLKFSVKLRKLSLAGSLACQYSHSLWIRSGGSTNKICILPSLSTVVKHKDASCMLGTCICKSLSQVRATLTVTSRPQQQNGQWLPVFLEWCNWRKIFGRRYS